MLKSYPCYLLPYSDLENTFPQILLQQRKAKKYVKRCCNCQTALHNEALPGTSALGYRCDCRPLYIRKMSFSKVP